MIEDLLRTLVRSQIGGLKRRVSGAILEAAALGMIGLATVFLSIGFYLFLGQMMEAWQAALILSAVASSLAVLLALIGRSLMRRRKRRQKEQLFSGLEGLGLLSSRRPFDQPGDDEKREPGQALVVAALAAGVILGRSMKQ